jgi:hypothetical protein
VCVISNDSGWGMISLVEKYIRPEEIATRGQCNETVEKPPSLKGTAG